MLRNILTCYFNYIFHYIAQSLDLKMEIFAPSLDSTFLRWTNFATGLHNLSVELIVNRTRIVQKSLFENNK